MVLGDAPNDNDDDVLGDSDSVGEYVAVAVVLALAPKVCDAVGDVDNDGEGEYDIVAVVLSDAPKLCDAVGLEDGSAPVRVAVIDGLAPNESDAVLDAVAVCDADDPWECEAEALAVRVHDADAVCDAVAPNECVVVALVVPSPTALDVDALGVALYGLNVAEALPDGDDVVLGEGVADEVAVPD